MNNHHPQKLVTKPFVIVAEDDDYTTQRRVSTPIREYEYRLVYEPGNKFFVLKRYYMCADKAIVDNSSLLYFKKIKSKYGYVYGLGGMFSDDQSYKGEYNYFGLTITAFDNNSKMEIIMIKGLGTRGNHHRSEYNLEKYREKYRGIESLYNICDILDYGVKIVKRR